MKRLKEVLGGVLVFGLLAMIPMGCSDSDSGNSPAPPSVPTNRIYILSATGDATLIPAVEANASTNGQSWEYTLTLEDVTENVFWFSDKPERDSGNETAAYFFETVWPEVYVEIAPNAILEGKIPDEDLDDGLFLALRNPVYDSAMNQLTFDVTLQNSTMTDKHPQGPVTFEDVKITINDNNEDNQVVEWSYGQVGPLATLAPEGTEGKYILSFENVYPECYYMSNAPDRYSFVYTVELLTETWNNHFEGEAPNASIISYNAEGELQANAFTIENPVYDSEIGLLTYTATLLENSTEPDEYLYDATLFIDAAKGESCDKQMGKSGFTGRFTVKNSSTSSMWISAIAPGGTSQPEVAKQWDWWKNKYGEKYEIKGGATAVFCVPDGGAPGGKFYFRMGCDEKGENCILGAPTGAMAGINTWFEPSFGCKFNKDNKKEKIPGCAFNPSANAHDFPKFPDCISTPTLENCPSIGGTDFFDLSTVDGYTIPLFLEVKGTNCRDNKGPRTTTDASMLDLASCPSDSKATLYSGVGKGKCSDTEYTTKQECEDKGGTWTTEQQELINAGISWLTKDKEYLQGCVSPCHWFSVTGIGDPENSDPTTPSVTPPWIAANYYCCQGTSGGSGPQEGASQCVEGPSDGTKTYPITLTNYVKSLKAVGYRGYTWQYDDFAATMTCDWGTQMNLTLVPNGGVPYDPNTKWAYANGKCTGGKKGSYDSLLACQQANMKYTCHPEKYTGLTVNYCVVDPQGAMTWEACQSSCKN